jgi:hypothetical protein
MGLDVHSSSPNTSLIFELIASPLKPSRWAVANNEQARHRVKLEREPQASSGYSRVWGLLGSRGEAGHTEIQQVRSHPLRELHEAMTSTTLLTVSLSFSPTFAMTYPEIGGAQNGHYARRADWSLRQKIDTTGLSGCV